MAGYPEGLSVALEPSCLDDPDPFRSLAYWLCRGSLPRKVAFQCQPVDKYFTSLIGADQ